MKVKETKKRLFSPKERKTVGDTDYVLTRDASPWVRFVRYFKRDWQLHILLLLPVVYLIIFDYVPMYGVQIAFRDFRAAKGIIGSEWVGLKWFERFFKNPNSETIILNTIILSLYTILVSFTLPVIFALLINTIRNERFKKITQTVAYFPHFLSVVMVVSILNMIFSPISGLYGTIYRLLGNEGYPDNITSSAETFRSLYVWSGVWQQLGWNTIIYTAALSGVSQELHEAAMLDGASRWKRVIHIDLPAILPTVGIMLILRFGSLMSVGHQKVYLMQNPLNLTTSEIISTHIYKVGMGSSRDFSYGAAVGLLNTLVNITLLLIVNKITKKISKGEVGLV